MCATLPIVGCMVNGSAAIYGSFLSIYNYTEIMYIEWVIGNMRGNSIALSPGSSPVCMQFRLSLWGFKGHHLQ